MKIKGYTMKKRVFIFALILIFSLSVLALCVENEPLNETGADNQPVKTEDLKNEESLNIRVKQKETTHKIYILGFSDTVGHKFELSDYVAVSKGEVRKPYFAVVNSEDFEKNAYAMANYNTELYVYPQSYGDMNFKIRAYLSEEDFAEFDLKLVFCNSAAQWKDRASKIILPGVLLLLALLLFWLIRVKSVKIACTGGDKPAGFGIRIGNRKYFFSFSKLRVKEREFDNKGREYYCNYFEIKKGERNSLYLVVEEDGKKVSKNVYDS